MDFDTLFQDLENQLEHELDAELINRLEDEERERRSKLTLRDRLAALHRSQSSEPLVAFTRDGKELSFSIKNVGKDWVALDVTEPYELQGPLICAVHAMRSIRLPHDGVKESLGTPIGEVSDHDLSAFTGKARLVEKVNLAFVLRDVSRRRKQVTIHTSAGTVTGTIDHVGLDHLDVTEKVGRQILALRDVYYVQMI